MGDAEPVSMTARIHVHATFTVDVPIPLFMVAAEVIEGTVEPGMFVTIPFNPSFGMTVRILSTAMVRNDFGIELLGLVLNCDGDSEARRFIDALNIGDEIWGVGIVGNDGLLNPQLQTSASIRYLAIPFLWG